MPFCFCWGTTPHQPRSLEEQAARMLADQGLPKVPFTANLAYNDARRETAGSQAGRYYAPALCFLSWQPFVMVAVCSLLTVLLACLLPS